MGTKRVVFDHSAPVGIDHFGPACSGSDTVFPVVLIGKATSGPTQVGYLNLFESRNYVVAITIGVGDRRFRTHPDATVNTITQMFSKMSVNVFADLSTRLVGVDNHIGLFRRYSHRGNTEDSCQDKKVFFHSDRIIQFVDKKFCIQQR